ncbi:MAG: DUF2782 domain-containing protein [Proteobacteria bacterium]|nr:DUF2782 domain-containing protein [Pseudomonadota bacterium]
MNALLRLAAVLPMLLPLAAAAQAPEPADAVRGGEPKVERIVTEDDGVRIEELRVRGQTQRIVVHSKLGSRTRPYEIVPANGGRDLSQDKDKGAIGQRVWSILSF